MDRRLFIVVVFLLLTYPVFAQNIADKVERFISDIPTYDNEPLLPLETRNVVEKDIAAGKTGYKTYSSKVYSFENKYGFDVLINPEFAPPGTNIIAIKNPEKILASFGSFDEFGKWLYRNGDALGITTTQFSEPLVKRMEAIAKELKSGSLTSSQETLLLEEFKQLAERRGLAATMKNVAFARGEFLTEGKLGVNTQLKLQAIRFMGNIEDPQSIINYQQQEVGLGRSARQLDLEIEVGLGKAKLDKLNKRIADLNQAIEKAREEYGKINQELESAPNDKILDLEKKELTMDIEDLKAQQTNLQEETIKFKKKLELYESTRREPEALTGKKLRTAKTTVLTGIFSEIFDLNINNLTNIDTETLINNLEGGYAELRRVEMMGEFLDPMVRRDIYFILERIRGEIDSRLSQMNEFTKRRFLK